MITKEQYACLAERYIDTVWRVALGYVKSPTDADDITQNVFCALLRSRKEFESEEHARFWLIRVTVNECRKWFRAPWRKSVSFEEYAQGLVFAREESRELLHAVMDLPVKYRLPIMQKRTCGHWAIQVHMLHLWHILHQGIDKYCVFAGEHSMMKIICAWQVIIML